MAGHIDDQGQAMPQSAVFAYEPALPDHTDAPAERVATFIRTPRVTALVRQHFGCDDLPGAPLEDLPLGRGSHWESRVFGPEFMSYGAGTGEPYVSDLTLAMLEDTNQYLANYTFAGGIVLHDEEDEDEARITGLSIFKGDLVRDDPASVPLPTSPGVLRWGRGGGCGFVHGNPAVEWDERHLCRVNREYGCTSDNRMSAVCIVEPGLGISSSYSCGRRSSDDPTCSSGPQLTEGYVDECDGEGARTW